MIVGFSAILVASVMVFLVWGLGYGALLVATVDAAQGQAVSMSRAWRTMVRPRVFGTCLLAALAVAVGCALCVLPGLRIGVLFSRIVPVLAAEGRVGVDAFARSAQLARYHPRGDLGGLPLLKLFLLFVLGYLLSAAAGFVVQLPFLVIQQVMVFRAAAEGGSDPTQVMATATWLQVPGNVLNALVTTAVQISMAFALTLFYLDIRRRQEGGDLEAAIQQMKGPQGAPPAVSG
jgi:hypothetical protein